MTNIQISEPDQIQNLIYTVRGVQVMLDGDLSRIYGVETRVLNQAVKRNIERFPEEFRFQLTREEVDNWTSQIGNYNKTGLRSQNVILKKSRGQHSKYLPYAFTEQGVAMLSAVLKSETAVKVSVGIIAYCLMPNHYHFLVCQLTERPVSNWIRDLFNGYTQAINRQQQRSGTLFEGRAKHRNIIDDDYLLHLICYIHGNPMDSGLSDSPENWEYSNYRECTGIRKGRLFDPDLINARFGSLVGYREFFENYYLNSETRNEFKDVFNG